MTPTSSRKSPPPKQLWVMPHPNGGWQAKHAGKGKAAIVADTKAKVLKEARPMAKHGKDELIVTGLDHLIQWKDSEGNDPRNIPG